jgi:membrane-bound metal-dependent hydrolase YbcI (DUF457 family)
MFVLREWPFHRWAHTFALALVIGVATGLAVWATAEPVLRHGGVTHPLLDGLMHDDIQPLMPFAGGNPFLGLMSLATLHFSCVAAAAVGVALLLVSA